MLFFQYLCGFVGFYKHVNKNFLKNVLTNYVKGSIISVSTGKDSRQCSSGGFGIHRKIPKSANKTFSKKVLDIGKRLWYSTITDRENLLNN